MNASELQVTDGLSITYKDISLTKAYSFKVAAETTAGVGPFSPVQAINPSPTGAFTHIHTMSTDWLFRPVLRIHPGRRRCM